MEVYEIPMRETAGMALEELAFNLEQEIQRFIEPYTRDLSPHPKDASLAPESPVWARQRSLICGMRPDLLAITIYPLLSRAP